MKNEMSAIHLKSLAIVIKNKYDTLTAKINEITDDTMKGSMLLYLEKWSRFNDEKFDRYIKYVKNKLHEKKYEVLILEGENPDGSGHPISISSDDDPMIREFFSWMVKYEK